MKFTLSTLLKLLTTAGRREVVRGLLEAEASRDKLVQYAGSATAATLNAGMAKLTPERLATVRSSLEVARQSITTLLDCTDPESDGGVTITPDEATRIAAGIHDATAGMLTDEFVKSVHDAIVERIP